MQILFTFLNRQPDLRSWDQRDFSRRVLAGPRPSDNRDHHVALAATETAGEPEVDGPFRRIADAIMNYRIFPAQLVEPILDRGPIQSGDTVGLAYRGFPGVALLMACRVIDVFDGPKDGVWRTGFTYRTLQGHAALGEETFCVEKEMATGRVSVSLQSWSRPAHWLMRIGYPLARWCQLHAGRSALKHLQEVGAGRLHNSSTLVSLS